MRNGSNVDRAETGRIDKEITVIAAVERTRDRTIEGSIGCLINYAETLCDPLPTENATKWAENLMDRSSGLPHFCGIFIARLQQGKA